MYVFFLTMGPHFLSLCSVNEQWMDCFMITGKSGQWATSSHGKLDTCSKFSLVFPCKWLCRALFNPGAKLPTELPAAAPPPCQCSVVCSSRHAAAVCRSSSGCSGTQSFSPFTERTPDVVPARCQLFSPSHRQPLSAFLPPTLEGQFFPSSCLHFFFLSFRFDIPSFSFFCLLFWPPSPCFLAVGFLCYPASLCRSSLLSALCCCWRENQSSAFSCLYFQFLFLLRFVHFFFLNEMCCFFNLLQIYLDFHEFGSSVCPPHLNHTTFFF